MKQKIDGNEETRKKIMLRESQEMLQRKKREQGGIKYFHHNKLII